MSGGRNKLGDFAQLKSLVSSKIKGLKEKKERMRAKSNGSKDEQNSSGISEKVSRGYKNHNQSRQPVKRMEKASTHRNFHMPQYGQKVDLDEDFSKASNMQDEIVIAIDTKQQVQMDERRLFGWLCKRFSKCFNPKNKKPLKIGISEEIEIIYKNENHSDIDQMALRHTLRRYVGDQNYQRAILKYKARYDLRGDIAEEMTPEHLEHATNRLLELKEKAEFRKQGGTNKEFYEMKAKADVEADVKADVEADVKADVEADVKADVEADVKADVEADVKADVEADVKADVNQIEREVK
jgi:ProP effector